MNAPCSGSWSEAPPTATPISPASITRDPSRPVNAVRSACSRKVTRRAWPGSSGTRAKPASQRTVLTLSICLGAAFRIVRRSSRAAAVMAAVLLSVLPWWCCSS